MRRSAIAALTIAAITVAACSNPAQAEIDRGNELAETGKLGEAFTAYDAALEIDPDNPNALAGRGCSRLHAKAADGIADLNRAIELDPKNYNAYRCRASAHQADGEYGAAIAGATKAIDLKPSLPYAHVILGDVLDDMGSNVEATREYDKAIEVAPESPVGYTARALYRVRIDVHDLDGALNDAEKAIALGRTDAFAYYTRGLIYAERGDKSAAKADLGKAIQMASTAEFAEQVRALMVEYGLE